MFPPLFKLGALGLLLLGALPRPDGEFLEDPSFTRLGARVIPPIPWKEIFPGAARELLLGTKAALRFVWLGRRPDEMLLPCMTGWVKVLWKLELVWAG